MIHIDDILGSNFIDKIFFNAYRSRYDVYC